jgi:uncharacterized protein (TIGR02996 family)
MATPQELLEQIARHPEDDTLRLAYADAVEHRMPERSEFIRLQIARFREEDARGASRCPGPREAALRERHGLTWARFIAPFTRPLLHHGMVIPGYKFERGFVAWLRTDPDTVGAKGDQLVTMAPIEHLDLTGEGPFIPALTAPCLGQMRSLSLTFLGLGDDDAIALAERGHLDRCEWLNLNLNHIDRRGVAALLANPVIRQMPFVGLRSNPGDPAVGVAIDYDGSVLDSWLPLDGEDAEARYGRISWLHISPYGVAPNRFHPRPLPPEAGYP